MNFVHPQEVHLGRGLIYRYRHVYAPSYFDFVYVYCHVRPERGQLLLHVCVTISFGLGYVLVKGSICMLHSLVKCYKTNERIRRDFTCAQKLESLTSSALF
jgi:hypothetical protein